MKKLLCTLLSLALLASAAPALAVEGESETSKPASTTEDKKTESTTESATPDGSSPEGAKPAEGDTEDEAKPEDVPPATDEGEATPAPIVFPDLDGHWGQAVMQKASDDGYLLGYPDGTLRPDATITGEQLRNILSRVLGFSSIPGPTGEIDRADTFSFLSEVLLLGVGETETSLSQFADAWQLTAEQRAAVSALAANKAIQGDQNKNLRPNDAISRAEFVAILYRLPRIEPSAKELLVEKSAARLAIPAELETLTLKDGVTLDTLVLGANCNGLVLTLGKDAAIDTLYLTGSGNKLSLPAGVSKLIVTGDKNTVTVDTKLAELSLPPSSGNTVEGKGSVALCHNGESNNVTIKVEKSETAEPAAVPKAPSVSLVAPATLPVGGLLRVEAKIGSYAESIDCKGLWLAGGKVVKEERITVSQDGGKSEYLADFFYSKDMNTDFELSFQLVYEDGQGGSFRQEAKSHTKLENHPAEYYDLYTVEKVLARVKTGFIGDGTTAWAEQNDYDAKTKEIWINAKGHSSSTEYLLWINTTYQRVNVFQGSQGNWKLIKEFMCSTGRRGTDTPVGVYTVTYRQPRGWTTSTYHVSPVIRFKTGSGLAFHSRQYDPSGTRLVDPSIGFPSSQGCIRMYDEEVHWIDDMIPSGTTVVVF